METKQKRLNCFCNLSLCIKKLIEMRMLNVRQTNAIIELLTMLHNAKRLCNAEHNFRLFYSPIHT